MTFNKHFPHRPEVPGPEAGRLLRARWLRVATWASTLMLVVGYLLVFAHWH